MAGYTEEQRLQMRQIIHNSTSEQPTLGPVLDNRCGTSPGSRAAIVKALREQGDPVIGREWRQPFGYFWGVSVVDCTEQARMCRHRAASYLADASRFDEHAARLQAAITAKRRERERQTSFALTDRPHMSS